MGRQPFPPLFARRELFRDEESKQTDADDEDDAEDDHDTCVLARPGVVSRDDGSVVESRHGDGL